MPCSTCGTIAKALESAESNPEPDWLEQYGEVLTAVAVVGAIPITILALTLVSNFLNPAQ